jgi:hypothetical protein
MGSNMKTTIEISDSLMAKAKELSLIEGRTFRDIVEEGLRNVLARSQPKPGFRLKKSSYKGKGLKPEYAFQSWSKIREAAYEGHGQ